MVVMPSCAVTTVVMVFAPTFKLILLLATPVATAVPFTVTVALAWFTVGVKVIEDTVFATDCVYVIVPPANVGVNAPLDNDRFDRFALVEAGALTVKLKVEVAVAVLAPVTVTVYVVALEVVVGVPVIAPVLGAKLKPAGNAGDME